MYKTFVAAALLLLNPWGYALTQEQLETELERAAAQAAVSNKNVMNDNILLTVSFTEKGIRPISEKDEYLMSEIFELHAPSWSCFAKEQHPNYEYKEIFTYEATPQERMNGLAYEKNGFFYTTTNELLEGRTPVSGRLWFTGKEKTHAMKALAGCKTYALSEQWLLTSATCPLVAYDNSPLYSNGSVFRQRTDRKILQIRANDMPLYNVVYKANDHVLLIFVPLEDNPFMKYLTGKAKKLHILAFSRPENLFALNGKGHFFVHTSRWGWLLKDKTSAVPYKKSLEGDVFSAYSRFNGTATDPFFFAENGREYLMAYSTAEEKYNLDLIPNGIISNAPWYGENSNTYYLLNADDLEFIRKTVKSVDPLGWQRMKKQFFLDTPKKPYFSRTSVDK